MDLPTNLASKCMVVNEMYNQLKLSPNIDAVNQKSENLAAIQRGTGNDYYRIGNYVSALQCYCRALSIAPIDSVEYARAFGNRSAALYMLGQYEKCLVDVEYALQHGKEENLKPKLIKRKKSCKEIISRRPVKIDDVEIARSKLFSMSESRNNSIICANVPMRIEQSKANMRRVVASEDIPAGKLIALEKPYAFHICEQYYAMRCHNCCTRSDGLIPCEHCASVMFCDEKCRQESWQTIHQWVCPFISIIFKKITNVDFVALNCFLKSRSDKSSWSEFYESIKKADRTIDNVLTRGYVPYSDGNLVFDSSDYCSVYTLATDRTSASSEKIFAIATTAALFVHFLEKYTKFFEDAPKDSTNNPTVVIDKYRFLSGGLILQNIMIALSNPVQLGGLTPNIEKIYEDVRFGFGIYPLCSVIEHSCAPNLSIVFKDNKVALITISPVKKNQPFTANCGGNYTVQPLEMRQKQLKIRLQFTCECEACVNKWPLLSDLQPGSFNKFTCTFGNVLSAIGLRRKEVKYEDVATIPIITGLKTGNIAMAAEVLPKLCAGITYLDDYKPCLEYANYQNLMRIALGLMGNILPPDDVYLLSYPDEVVNKYSV